MESLTAAAFVVSPHPASALSFVCGDALKVGNCWVVDANCIPDGMSGFEAGEALAEHYLAFIRGGNGLSLPGGLMQIVSSMARHKALDRRITGDGNDIAAGFFTVIDQALLRS